MRRTERPLVFLLHGIGRTPLDMWPMARGLAREGFAVVNWGYPSRRSSIADLASMLAAQVASYDAPVYHFVGHSMGGIILRKYLAEQPPARVGRLVMIGSPNQGSKVAEFFGEWWLFRKIFGPAGQELRCGSPGICSTIGIPKCEFGIIAGGLGNRWGMNPLLGSDNDGTVTVEETLLEGACDFLLLPYPHPIIQAFPRTVRNTLHFLRHGRFAESSATAPRSAAAASIPTDRA
ncbi:MAG: alpha/beta fold hydrolase [Candidatus Hydrogenedentota bacterium]|nr:MAG: alpha/beta fold hydrolase [Candidatus Hydrogenedentota bacterium]GIX43693.1 MAG: acetyltransferase [Candidatus Sumerlaea sp.]